MFYLYGKRLVKLVIIVSSSTKGAFIPFISRLPCSEKRPQIFGILGMSITCASDKIP